MSEQIELTEAEHQAAATAVFDSVVGQSKSPKVVVDNVLEAINKVRAGLPVGTVRRNSATGSLVERREINGVRYWAAIDSFPMFGISPRTDRVADGEPWETIYTPEVM